MTSFTRRRVGVTVFVATCAAFATVRSAIAQEQPARDSLAVQVRRLQARLDSLASVLEQLRSQGPDTAKAHDALAALRTAAQQAAGRAEMPDTTTQQQSRTRNLQALNPEISVTGDVVANYAAPAGGDRIMGATPREFEFSIQAPLDPYTRTKVFVTREEGFDIAGLPTDNGGDGFEIEEGYIYWVGLPGGIGAQLGKFRQDIGLYNRWHTHALPEIDRPLAPATFLGPDGLIQTGLSVSAPPLSLGPSTESLSFELTRGTNDALFQGGGDLSYLGRFQSFWDLSGTTYLQVGATGVAGGNGDLDLRTRLATFDASFRWTPPQARFHDFTLKGEWYLAQQRIGGVTQNGHGGYAQANYRLDQRWIVGARADYVQGYGAVPTVVQFVPSVTWWQSEWVRLRLQYNYVKPDGGQTNHTLLLQVVWAAGPHKHESY